MTTKKAIEVFERAIDFLSDKNVKSDVKLSKDELPLLSEVVKALKVRQRLEEAISSMEANDTWSIHISKLKSILKGEE